MTDTTTPGDGIRLDGKVAVVSGAARGQGRAIAVRLAAAGASVVAGDVRVDDLATLDEELGEAVLTGGLDVRERSSWDSLVHDGVDTFGRIDILVNNAGVLRMSDFTSESAEDFENIWRVNTLGVFHGMQAVVSQMRSVGGGAILNTLSTAALAAYASHASYASSKWANRGLTKVAAMELARYGIRVNAIAPGPIATPMIIPEGDTAVRERLSKTPVGRIGEPEDIAEAVLFLVSDAASFIVGAELTVDGGAIVGYALGE